MKGRDYGLPDYNTARKVMGLPPLQDFDDFIKYNDDLNTPEGQAVSGFNVGCGGVISV